MRKILAGALAAVLLGGCAAFKELEPDPKLSPAERGYVELKNDQENFELEKDGKYFIRFPAPSQDRFNLVLVTSAKTALRTYLTATFDDGETRSDPIPDEAPSSDSVLVYAIDTGMPTFYWVIESVDRDLELRIRYRYVPQWRYRFETRYSEYREVLTENTVDRTTYNSISPGWDLDRLNITTEIPYVEGRTAKIKTMRDDLLRLESVFPPAIAASKDTAYERYIAFKKEVDNELSFHEDYSTILKLFKNEKETRGNTAQFLEAAPYYTGILSQRERFPATVRMKAIQIVSGRLSEVTPYLSSVIRNKSDLSKISPAPQVETVAGLYRACDQQIPQSTESAVRFINRFNAEVDGLRASNNTFAALKDRFNSYSGPASESFYADLAARARELKASIPKAEAVRFEPYGSSSCAAMLGREIASASNRADDLVALYESSATIAGDIGMRMWGPAEIQLRDLHATPSLSTSPDITGQHTTLVRRFENDIFTAVKTTSEQRIDAFIKMHEMAIDNVPELYADSAFLPVYQLTFSSLGHEDLVRKRNEIKSYLDRIKYVEFPESSIKRLYSEFTRNVRDRGVEKARAIVEHGKFYKGSDEQVKKLIFECDVNAAKWVVRPREYRRLFALPVTSNKQGTNQYLLRIRLEIPSEAEFPVFDVNLKLPQEVAEKAGQVQWYESITIDNKPIKNEGRFRITAPTAENNYETLITPVQMDKAGRNILEVRFRYPGFRVFEVSAMAQVPIIRKN